MIILVIHVTTTNSVMQMVEHFNFSHFVLLTHTVPGFFFFLHVPLENGEKETFQELECFCINP